jgi:hypothetical protein
MSWDGAQKQAMKILGDGATVPDKPSTVTKASADWDKTGAEFKAAREACEEKVLAMDNANSAFVNAFEQFRARIEKNNFELDPKKDLKKIDQARKILLADIDGSIKQGKINDKTLDELNRHLIQLAQYKQS